MSTNTNKLKEQKAGKITDTRSTKYLLTLNNPIDNGWDRERIITQCKELNPVYFCISDEIGLDEETPHCHLFMLFKNARYFSSIKESFHEFHIDESFGKAYQNVDYVFKEGKWLEDPKGETNLRDTHFEFGERPTNKQGKRNDIIAVKNMIDDGYDADAIVDTYPQYLFRYDQIQKSCERKKAESFADTERDLKVYYISGPTRSGKTYYVTHKYGHRNVFRVTNYKNPFDKYKGQDIVILDEFHGQLSIDEMLDLLDVYPTEMKGRYFDHTACFTKIYVISNSKIEDQFKQTQVYEPATFDAFIARFNCFMDFISRNERIVYNDFNDYLLGMGCSLEEYEAKELKESEAEKEQEENPKEAESYEQIKLEG